MTDSQMEPIFVTPIVLDDKPGKDYFLRSQIVEKGDNYVKVDLVLTNVENSYEATYESNDLSSKGNSSLEAFKLGNNVAVANNVKYVFILDNECQLTWKKVQLDDDGEEFHRKSVDSITMRKVAKEDSGAVYKLLKEITAQLIVKDEKVKQLSEDNEKLQKVCLEATNQLEKFTQMKKDGCDKLISVFTLLLNEKKAMIRDLLDSGHTFSRINGVWEHHVDENPDESSQDPPQKSNQRKTKAGTSKQKEAKRSRASAQDGN